MSNIFCEVCRQSADFFTFGRDLRQIGVCKEHTDSKIRPQEQALYPLEAYNFVESEKDYCLYKERRIVANQVRRVLEGLVQAVCEEKEAALKRLDQEKERITALIALTYEELKWRLEENTQNLTFLLYRYKSEVENYTKTKESCISSEITELREATEGSVLAFSLQDVACEVVKTLLESTNWHSDLCLSSVPCPTVPCDLEEQLETMLLHGYGPHLGTEKITQLMQKAKELECLDMWESAGNHYQRAASLAEIYSPCKAAELWVFLGINSKKFSKFPSKSCFNRAFSIFTKLKIENFPYFDILQSIGKLGIRIGECEAGLFALEQAIILPSLQPEQQFSGLLNIASALAATGQIGKCVMRLEAGLRSFPAPSNQATVLTHMGGLLLKAKKYEEAEQAFIRVFQLCEIHPNSLLNTQIFDRILSSTRAICAINQKSHFNVLENIGKMYIQLKEWSRAYEIYAELHSLSQFRSEKLALQIGKCCLMSHRCSDGVRILQKTIQKLQVERKDPSPELKSMLQRLQANS